MNKKSIIGIFFFPVLFIFMEAVMHLVRFGSFDSGLVYALLFSIPYGILAYCLTGFKNKIANHIAIVLITAITTIYFGLQTVYYNIFKVHVSLYSVSQNAGDVTEFWKEALHGIIASIPVLAAVIIIPVIAVVLMTKFGFIGTEIFIPASASGKSKKTEETPASVVTVARDPDDLPQIISRKTVVKENKVSPDKQKKGMPSFVARLIYFIAALLLYICTVLSLKIGGTSANTAYDLYHDNFVLDLGVEKLGYITSAGLDTKQVLFGGSDNLEEISDDASLTLIPTAAEGDASLTATLIPTQTADNTSDDKTPDDNTAKASATPTPLPSPTPIPIDTSPNVLNIDFSALAEAEKNKDIRSLHEYFAACEPTKKNEYTGMFKDYNLIYLTCEGYSPWAVDEEVTPTLYKLTHSGFVFTNFYNPIWYTSTSDGEYVECVGLLPYSTNSFKRSKHNALPFCFGWQFLKLGYNTRAYHAHTATYYGRNETHPNMGYIFKARGQGLKMTNTWPESDLEMMQLTLPEYINDEHFHTYYMTVSGHLEYSFNDNYQSRKNKELVDHLPYGSEVKAYIACNIELDKALEYLIDELEKAGKLDNTVIAFGGDHYPYGLSDAAIDEVAGHHVERNFELYRNNFVLWNSQIEEPIIIDKYCSSIDMMPTLSNLFGLEYDSRLFVGTDILSDAPALVIFGNQSFITDYCMYNSKTHEVTMLADMELPDTYIDTVSKIVRNKFTVSKNILLLDYYRYLLDYIPNVVTEVPESYVTPDTQSQ